MLDIPRNRVILSASKAFDEDQPYENGPTEIKVFNTVTVYRYYGHSIAFKYSNGAVYLANNRKFDYDVKQRLNSIKGVSLKAKAKKWYLNGKLWGGTLIQIKRKRG